MRVQYREKKAPTQNIGDQGDPAVPAGLAAEASCPSENPAFADPRWSKLANRFLLAAMKERSRARPQYLSAFFQYAQDLYPEGEPWK
ncbi:MAG: hypothetical protein LDL33_11895 [Desulfomonile sp.]|nr:hypothetical protein [Desulfomonile sp.]